MEENVMHKYSNKHEAFQRLRIYTG